MTRYWSRSPRVTQWNKPLKYRSRSCVLDNITFPSMGEANRYTLLKLAESQGQISDLRVHPTFPIVINGRLICRVVLDFQYRQQGKIFLEDFKGFDLPMSRLKRKLVEACYGITVQVVKASSQAL